MSVEYIVLESPRKRGILTIKIGVDQLFFNHTLIHEKEEYEAFGTGDYGVEKISNHNTYHINGHIITYNEYKFIHKTVIDL